MLALVNIDDFKLQKLVLKQISYFENATGCRNKKNCI